MVATTILTSYLVAVVNQHIPSLVGAAREQKANIKTLQAAIEQQNQLLSSMQSDLKKLSTTNSTPPKPSPEDKGKLAVDSLRNSLTKMAEADTKRQQGDMNSAIDLLKSVKQILWKAGDVLPAHQSALRALMGPLDIIINKWKQGDKSADTSKAALAVRTVLHKIDSKFDT